MEGGTPNPPRKKKRQLPCFFTFWNFSNKISSINRPLFFTKIDGRGCNVPSDSTRGKCLVKKRRHLKKLCFFSVSRFNCGQDILIYKKKWLKIFLKKIRQLKIFKNTLWSVQIFAWPQIFGMVKINIKLVFKTCARIF